jgi:hypothetical protein
MLQKSSLWAKLQLKLVLGGNSAFSLSFPLSFMTITQILTTLHLISKSALLHVTLPVHENTPFSEYFFS